MIVIIASYYYYCYQSQCQDLAQCTRRTGKATKAKKRAWHKEDASRTAEGERKRDAATYLNNVVCKNLCFVCLFVYAVLCEHTVRSTNLLLHTHIHTLAYIAVAHANLYTCTDATINFRRKISHFIAFCLPAFIFAGLSRVAIITARSSVIYTKCTSLIAITNPQGSEKKVTCPRSACNRRKD